MDKAPNSDKWKYSNLDRLEFKDGKKKQYFAADVDSNLDRLEFKVC